VQPQPLYSADNVHPAYELRYSWTGWPARQPLPVNTSVLTDLRPLWEGDGMRLLEDRRSDEMIQLTFFTRPDVSPVFLAGRTKGRLQYALRNATSNFSFRIAEHKGYKISRLSVMPDHLHAALRGNIEHSPQEIALAFQNNLAYAMGQVRQWACTFYAGTFGEYDMWAIRRKERSL